MTTALVSASDASVPPESPPGSASRRTVLLVWLGVVAGFVVALAALARPRWFPVLDLAQTEMRLRDVFTTDPPLVGLPGRIGTFQHQGSHPGPLSFWMLAPFYRLFGSSAWAMEAATASVNALAIGTSLWIARRRGGVAVFLAIAAAIALVLHFDGPAVMTEAWNPYLPMTWFMVFVLGIWSVLCDDLGVLPLTAFAAAFCLQTHISYLGLVGGLSALAAAWIAWRLWRTPNRLGPRRWWYLGFAAAIVLLTTLPPVIQELWGAEGNLTLLWRHFTNPPEDPIGLGRAVEVLLVHLNPWRLVAARDAVSGSVVPGLVVLAAWAGGVVVAWRLRVRELLALQVVLALSLVLGLQSIASIFGFVWYYLMRWAWTLNALVLVSIGWAAVALVRQLRPAWRAPIARVGSAMLVLVIAYGLVGFAGAARIVEPPDPRISETLGRLVAPTIAAIDADAVIGGGRSGRYQVTIVDTMSINGPGYGMVSELERAGIDAGFPPIFSAIVRPKRIVPKRDATAVIHLSVGETDIRKWDALPGVDRVARVDPRTPAERREATRLRATVRRQLVAAGRSDLVPNIEENVFTATFVPGLPRALQRNLLRLLEIGAPSAVFVGPPALGEPADGS